jgi:hypothetical protein
MPCSETKVITIDKLLLQALLSVARGYGQLKKRRVAIATRLVARTGFEPREYIVGYQALDLHHYFVLKAE